MRGTYPASFRHRVAPILREADNNLLGGSENGTWRSWEQLSAPVTMDGASSMPKINETENSANSNMSNPPSGSSVSCSASSDSARAGTVCKSSKSDFTYGRDMICKSGISLETPASSFNHLHCK